MSPFSLFGSKSPEAKEGGPVRLDEKRGLDGDAPGDKENEEVNTQDGGEDGKGVKEKGPPKVIFANDVEYDTNPTPLYKAIELKEWESVAEFIDDPSGPKEASTWVYRKEKNRDKLRWRLLPLHAAIIFKAPDEIVDALLLAYPDGASSQDDQGMIPLHLAFRHGSSDSVILKLLSVFPDSVKMKDRKGRPPVNLTKGLQEGVTEHYPLSPAAGKKQNKAPSGIATYVNLAIEHDRSITITKMAAEVEEQIKQESEEGIKLLREMAWIDKSARTSTEALIQQVKKQHQKEQDLRDRVQYLERDIKEVKDMKMIESSRLQEQVETLENVSNRYKERAETLDVQNASYKGSLDELKEQKESNEKELSQLTERIATLQQLISETNSNLKELEDQNVALQQELETVTDVANTKSKEASVLSEQRATLDKVVDQFKAKVAAMEASNATYKEDLDAARSTLKERDNQMVKAKLASEALIRQFNEKVDSEKQLKESLHTSEERLKQIEVENQCLERHASQMKALIDELESANSSYKSQVIELTDDVAEKNIKLPRLEEQVAVLDEVTKKMKERVQTLEGENVEYVEELEMLRGKTEQLEDENMNLQEQCGKSRVACEKLLHQYNLVCKEAEELKVSVADLDKKLKDVTEDSESKLQGFAEELKVCQRENSGFKKLIEELERTKSEQRSELAHLTQDCTTKDLVCKRMKEKTAIIERITTKFQVRTKELERINVDYDVKLQELSKELEDAKTNREKTNENLKEFEKSNAVLRQRIEELMQKNQKMSDHVEEIRMEQNTFLHAAMKREAEMKKSQKDQEMTIQALKRQIKETQSKADMERERIIRAAKQQKEAIEASFANALSKWDSSM